MIEMDPVLRYFFDPEPIPNPTALKNYSNRFPEFQKFISHYQTDEFALSILEGIYALCMFDDNKKEDYNKAIEAAFEFLIHEFMNRYNNNTKCEVKCSTTKTTLYSSKIWKQAGDIVTVDFNYTPFTSEIEAMDYACGEMIYKARQVYQSFHILKGVPITREASPADKDARSYQKFVNTLYKSYQGQWRAMFGVEKLELNKADSDDFILYYMQIHKGSLLEYLRTKCSTTASLLFNFYKLIYDKLKLFETSIFLMNEFPPDHTEEMKNKRLDEFLNMIDRTISQYKVRNNGNKLSANLEIKGHALTELGMINKNQQFYYRAITSFWEAIKFSKTAYKTKKISDNLNLIGVAIGEDKLMHLSTLVHSVFTSLPLFWAIKAIYAKFYDDCKENYIFHYKTEVQKLLDIKRIPGFFKDPTFYTGYAEILKGRNVDSLIFDLCIGMILWLQYAKLVLHRHSANLIDIECDLFFVLKLEEQYQKNPSWKKEWEKIIQKVKLEKYQFNSLETLLRKNQIL